MALSGDELFGPIYERGEIVCREGDHGNEMYIIQTGAVELTTFRDGKEIVLTQLEQGDFFGEMALIDNKLRTATATTLCRSRILSLTKKSFLSRISADPGIALHLLNIISRRIDRTNRLIGKELRGEARADEILDQLGEKCEYGSVEHCEDRGPISSFNYKDICDVLETRETETFEPGDIIFDQGGTDRSLYIITQGSVDIYHRDEHGTILLDRFGPGECFGEMALLTDNARSAAAVAKEKTSVITVEQQHMINQLKKEPELALFIVQLLILRLRKTVESLIQKKKTAHSSRLLIPPLLKKDRQITVSLISLSACSGCIVSILEEQRVFESILEKARIVYSPMLMDKNEISHADIAIVDGAVRIREEQKTLEEVRSKSRYVVAWGTCAAFGGIPAYANSSELEDLIEESYGEAEDHYAHYLSGKAGVAGTTYREDDLALLRKVGKLDEFVKVDYFLPGCPPEIRLLTSLIRELTGDPQTGLSNSIVCTECGRKRSKCKADSLRIYPEEESRQNICFNSQGTICLGFLTMAGCGGACPHGGFPCWSCRGPSAFALKIMDQGTSYEHILTESLKRICKLPVSVIHQAVDALRSRCLSMLNFEYYFVRDRSRLR